MNNTDVKALYDAFVVLCDYVEQKTEAGCMGCPRRDVCFGEKSSDFTESLARICETLNSNKTKQQ